MRITRLCAGAVVAGAITFGGIAPADAAAPPALKIGRNYDSHTAQIDLLPTPYTQPRIVVPLGVATVQVLGESVFGEQNGNVAQFLANPLPVNVCALCHPEDDDAA